MDYYIGIDGGGTKTAVFAASKDARVFLKAKTGSSSWREHGIKTVIGNIKEAVDDLPFDEGDRFVGMAMGLPCFGESVDGDFHLKQEIAAVFPGIPVYVTNDVEVGWAGSLALEPGINVVAGTGSIAYGRDIHGNTARSGGWDEFFSDEGSGHWMGRKMMELFSKQSDGRAPRGALYDIVRSEFGLSEDIHFIDQIRSHYLGCREKIASLQILLEKASLAGDESARALYHEAARELCSIAMAVKNQLDFSQGDCQVSYSGGIFKAGDLILPLFRELLEQGGARAILPKCTPAQGAALIAFEHFYPEGLQALKNALVKSK